MSKKITDMQRRRVNVELSSNLSDTTYLDELLRIVQDAKERATKEDIRDVSLKIETSRGYYDDVDVAVHLAGWRLETDEEFELRTREEAQRAKHVEESEYAQYIGLKRKFEGRSNDKFK